MKDLHKRAEIYRPYPSATVDAMIHARSAGHYVTGPGWDDGCVRKDFFELFWGVCGEGEFCLEGRSWILKPKEVWRRAQTDAPDSGLGVLLAHD